MGGRGEEGGDMGGGHGKKGGWGGGDGGAERGVRWEVGGKQGGDMGRDGGRWGGNGGRRWGDGKRGRWEKGEMGGTDLGGGCVGHGAPVGGWGEGRPSVWGGGAARPGSGRNREFGTKNPKLRRGSPPPRELIGGELETSRPFPGADWRKAQNPPSSPARLLAERSGLPAPPCHRLVESSIPLLPSQALIGCDRTRGGAYPGAAVTSPQDPPPPPPSNHGRAAGTPGERGGSAPGGRGGGRSRSPFPPRTAPAVRCR